MTTFYICRHGQTENNKYGKFSGWIDTPLTSEGVQDAYRAAIKLVGMPLDKIVASDLGRAFITAYLIARKVNHTPEIERTPALREVNYGDFANQPYSVYPVVSPDENTTFTSPGGESLAQMQQRVIAFITQLAGLNPGKNILLVGHDGTINAIKASFTGKDIGIVDQTHSAHDFVGRFTFDAGKVLSFEEIVL